MPERNPDFAGISDLVTDPKLQGAVADFVAKIPDLEAFLAERGIVVPADVTITFEMTTKPPKDPPKDPPKKCWKICVGKPPWGACFEHCTGG